MSPRRALLIGILACLAASGAGQAALEVVTTTTTTTTVTTTTCALSDWTGSWSGAFIGGHNGTWTGDFMQDGSDVSGTVTVTVDDLGGIVLPTSVSGTVQCDQITVGFLQFATFSGTKTGDEASGDWAGNDQTRGTWTASLVRPSSTTTTSSSTTTSTTSTTTTTAPPTTLPATTTSTTTTSTTAIPPTTSTTEPPTTTTSTTVPTTTATTTTVPTTTSTSTTTVAPPTTVPTTTVTTTTATTSTTTTTLPVVGAAIGVVSGRFFPNPTDAGLFTATPDSTPAFTQTFPIIDFDPPGGAVACSNDVGVGTDTRPFTDVVPQADGSCATLAAAAGGVQAGAGDLLSFNAVFQGSLTVDGTGLVKLHFYSDDGWVFGVGPGPGGAEPVYVDGPRVNDPGTTPFAGYPTVGAYNTASAPVPNDLTVYFPAAGAYPFEIDYSECCGGSLALTVTAERGIRPAVPAVEAIDPHCGSAEGGDTVTITGSGFTDDATVRFGDAAAPSVHVDSATRITAVSPAGSGTVDVTVATAAGTSGATPADRWAYDGCGPTTTTLPACDAGDPRACDDGNACTADRCDPAHGCRHDPVADGTPCAGDVCVGVSTCAAGACLALAEAASCVPPAAVAWLTNFSDDTLSAVDTGRAAVTATVPVGQGPWGIAVAPDGSRVWATNRNGNSLSVVDAARGTVVATVPVGSTPLGVALHPAGSPVYVANYGSDTLSVVDAATNAVTDTVRVGHGPTGVAVHPAGARVYVTNYLAGTVSVVDAASRKVVRTVRVGASPLGVTVDPSGAAVYVANHGDGTASVIGAASNTVGATLAVGAKPYAIAVDPTSSRLYVTAFGGDAVVVFDARTLARVATVPAGKSPLGVAVDAVDGRVYVADPTQNTLDVLGPGASPALAAVPVGRTPVGLGAFLARPPARCPRQGLACDDGDPFTLDGCVPATGCTHGALGTVAGALAATDQMAGAFHGPVQALIDGPTARRLETLRQRVRQLLAEAAGEHGAAAKRTLQRARRLLGKLLAAVAQAERQRKIPSAVAGRLLDLGRAIERELGAR